MTKSNSDTPANEYVYMICPCTAEGEYFTPLVLHTPDVGPVVEAMICRNCNKITKVVCGVIQNTAPPETELN